ncbi:hypothetical protein NDU88_000239 [Pleurodeles waltl]|uniref:Uncharacterized protein n=1 Tax=Pleurodeles waltl TaxID=8319 RepID=A0AAV7R982_PLEWA|nr:hypothetical protein NDU88_000239 [Pleurodeles waltl]
MCRHALVQRLYPALNHTCYVPVPELSYNASIHPCTTTAMYLYWSSRTAPLSIPAPQLLCICTGALVQRLYPSLHHARYVSVLELPCTASILPCTTTAMYLYWSSRTAPLSIPAPQLLCICTGALVQRLHPSLHHARYVSVLELSYSASIHPCTTPAMYLYWSSRAPPLSIPAPHPLCICTGALVQRLYPSLHHTRYVSVLELPCTASIHPCTTPAMYLYWSSRTAPLSIPAPHPLCICTGAPVQRLYPPLHHAHYVSVLELSYSASIHPCTTPSMYLYWSSRTARLSTPAPRPLCICTGALIQRLHPSLHHTCYVSVLELPCSASIHPCTTPAMYLYWSSRAAPLSTPAPRPLCICTGSLVQRVYPPLHHALYVSVLELSYNASILPCTTPAMYLYWSSRAAPLSIPAPHLLRICTGALVQRVYPPLHHALYVSALELSYSASIHPCTTPAMYLYWSSRAPPLSCPAPQLLCICTGALVQRLYPSLHHNCYVSVLELSYSASIHPCTTPAMYLYWSSRTAPLSIPAPHPLCICTGAPVHRLYPSLHHTRYVSVLELSYSASIHPCTTPAMYLYWSSRAPPLSIPAPHPLCICTGALVQRLYPSLHHTRYVSVLELPCSASIHPCTTPTMYLYWSSRTARLSTPAPRPLCICTGALVQRVYPPLHHALYVSVLELSYSASIHPCTTPAMYLYWSSRAAPLSIPAPHLLCICTGAPVQRLYPPLHHAHYVSVLDLSYSASIHPCTTPSMYLYWSSRTTPLSCPAPHPLCICTGAPVHRLYPSLHHTRYVSALELSYSASIHPYTTPATYLHWSSRTVPLSIPAPRPLCICTGALVQHLYPSLHHAHYVSLLELSYSASIHPCTTTAMYLYWSSCAPPLSIPAPRPLRICTGALVQHLYPSLHHARYSLYPSLHHARYISVLELSYSTSIHPCTAPGYVPVLELLCTASIHPCTTPTMYLYWSSHTARLSTPAPRPLCICTGAPVQRLYPSLHPACYVSALELSYSTFILPYTTPAMYLYWRSRTAPLSTPAPHPAMYLYWSSRTAPLSIPAPHPLRICTAVLVHRLYPAPYPLRICTGALVQRLYPPLHNARHISALELSYSASIHPCTTTAMYLYWSSRAAPLSTPTPRPLCICTGALIQCLYPALHHTCYVSVLELPYSASIHPCTMPTTYLYWSSRTAPLSIPAPHLLCICTAAPVQRLYPSLHHAHYVSVLELSYSASILPCTTPGMYLCWSSRTVPLSIPAPHPLRICTGALVQRLYQPLHYALYVSALEISYSTSILPCTTPAMHLY